MTSKNNARTPSAETVAFRRALKVAGVVFVVMCFITLGAGMDSSDSNKEIFNGGPGVAMIVIPPLLVLFLGGLFAPPAKKKDARKRR